MFRSAGLLIILAASRQGKPEGLPYDYLIDTGGTENGGVNTFSRTFTVVVEPVNDAPVAANDAYGVKTNIPRTVGSGIGILVNDSDVDGDALTPTSARTGPNVFVTLRSSTLATLGTVFCFAMNGLSFLAVIVSLLVMRLPVTFSSSPTSLPMLM